MVDHQEQTKWTALPTDEIPETAVTSEEESVERLEKSKPRAHYVARNHHQDDSSASPPKFLYLMHAISILAVAMAVLLSLSLSFTKRFLIIRRDLARLNMPYGNPVPRMPIDTRTFAPSQVLFERPNAQSDAAWDALAGYTLNDKGFIYIPNWEELRLPPSTPEAGEGMYGISMYQQLQCLSRIRSTFWQLMDGQLDPAELAARDGNTLSPNFIPHDNGLWRIQHCFDYLRNALQCYGDTDLEVPTAFNGQRLFLGWNSSHECRHFGTIWDYTVAHSS